VAPCFTEFGEDKNAKEFDLNIWVNLENIGYGG
jgi:hypothetical protein